MKILINILFFSLLHFSLFSQNFSGDGEDIGELTKKKLLVVLMELDEDVIEKIEKKITKTNNLEKNKERTEKLESYKKFINDYNESIKKNMTELWKLNKEIEFKTASEVSKLADKKSSNYAILAYYGSEHYLENISLPTLVYSDIQNVEKRRKWEFMFHIIPTAIEVDREDVNFSPTDLNISIKVMQNQLNEILKIDKKSYNTKDFAKDQAKKNCREIKDQPIYIDKDLVTKKESEEKLSSKSPNEIKFVDSETIQSFIEEDADKIVCFTVPDAIIENQVGFVTIEQLTFIKLLVNTNTGKIYSRYGGSGLEGLNYDLWSLYLKNILDCN